MANHKADSNGSSSRSSSSKRSVRANSHNSSSTRRSSSRAAVSRSSAHTHRAGGSRPNSRAGGNPRGRANGRKGGAAQARRIGKYALWSILGIILAGIVTLGVAYATIQIPSPESIALSQATSVYYNDGTTKIGSFKRENREIISCETLPDYVGNAIVASENRTFWTDSGIDLRGIARALVNNVTTGSRQGGSTITQQYAERYYLGETKSYAGKVKEALLALKIASQQDKDTVLCGYMNTIYFGRGAYGIQAAAHAYFNKDAKDLTVSEAALLAGIIPAPSAWDPRVDEASAQKRFDRVIKFMAEDGYLTAQQKSEAAFPSTIEYTVTDDYAGYKGYLLTMVKDELVSSGKFTEDELMTGGYKIVTTISKANQDLMQQTVENGGAPETLSTGGMSADVDTGEIIAVYAGSDYITKPLNNATQASYQPGSTMKTFTLLGAIQAGTSLQTYFNGNSPRSFAGLASSVPNYANISYGNINLITALANSVNTVFVDLNQHVTPQKTAEIAKQAGISSKLQSDSLYDTLGIDGVHLSEIVQAYQTIAHDGVKNNLHIVRQVFESDETTSIYTANTTGTQVFSASDTALATTAMRAVVTQGTSTIVQRTGKTIAGKSGTANDDTAVSFVGFSRHVVTAFANWNTGEDGSAQVLPSFGAYTNTHGYATYLFTQYMKTALADTKDEAFPTAKDTGKVGGSDGTWGLGATTARRSTQREEETTQEQPDSQQPSNTTQNAPDTTTNNSQNQNQTQTNPQTTPNTNDSNAQNNQDDSSTNP